MTSTIDLKPGAHSVVEDYDAICGVVQLCLDGEATGDVEKLREAFHEDARMFGSLAGERYDGPISTLMDMVVESPADTGRSRSRVLSVHQTRRCSAGDSGRGGLLGNRVLHRLPFAVPHQRKLEDRQQVVCPHRRRAARPRVAVFLASNEIVAQGRKRPIRVLPRIDLCDAGAAANPALVRSRPNSGSISWIVPMAGPNGPHPRRRSWPGDGEGSTMARLRPVCHPGLRE